MNWSNYSFFYPLFPVTFAFQLLPGTLPVYRQLFLQHTAVLCTIATAAVVFLRKICADEAASELCLLHARGLLSSPIYLPKQVYLSVERQMRQFKWEHLRPSIFIPLPNHPLHANLPNSSPKDNQLSPLSPSKERGT